ncbi:sugar phosphate nucleotidyltransferase [Mesorhizobium sp. L-8-3]|uniref:sugar phosphate nucleotidyltransferase n=1 Tax=Mesorhizobium sp. L-8-3 TaxID=2744522 RepID=UPI001928CE77|nr:sugar phosphate nucleotidyltransferase [Mesorhizobium sp. L-8-3]BCH26061.1 hypothetical protein MesoLjLb_58460 [Mesorhizobium sp. L-8-3]
MAERITSFVMSGGIGSRLWPLSREDNPKQFHDLSGNGSMLSKTLQRLKARREGETPIFLIASERHAERVLGDLEGIDLAGGGAIFEPAGRNTAAAVAIAALHVLTLYEDGLVLVAPSDHEISTDEQFWRTVERGVAAAQAGRLVVFGIRPTQPETGCGYIEASETSDAGVADVLRFVEKPDLDRAKAYLAAGNFFWNTGMFLFRASTMRDAFLQLRPEIWQACEAAYLKSASDLSGLYLPLDLYLQVPSISIDYAIAERLPDIAMVPASFRWNDLGSWQSLLDAGLSDKDGNVVVGDVVAIDCANSYLRSEGRLLSVIGLHDVAVVSTSDATFVAPVSYSQNVKKIVEQLERSGRLETRYTPATDRVLESGAWRTRVHHWLFEETLPLWSTSGVDDRHGGFHEALAFDGTPLVRTKRMRTMARQIYAFAVAKERGWTGPADRLANGLNRATGLAYAAVSRQGIPLDGVSRSWPQTEVIKAAIALDGTGGPDMKPEIEARVRRLFRWHIDPAPLGLWIDRIDEKGRSLAADVPASIFYHMVCALMQYLDATADAGDR